MLLTKFSILLICLAIPFAYAAQCGFTSDCAVCYLNSTCTQCNPGYTIDEDLNGTIYEGDCEMCPSNCDTCEYSPSINGPDCTVCSTGYALYDARCYECPNDCSKSCYAFPTGVGNAYTQCSSSRWYLWVILGVAILLVIGLGYRFVKRRLELKKKRLEEASAKKEIQLETPMHGWNQAAQPIPQQGWNQGVQPVFVQGWNPGVQQPQMYGWSQTTVVQPNIQGGNQSTQVFFQQ